MPISEAMTESVFSSHTDDVYIVLVEIEHEDLAETLRFAGNGADITHDGDTYHASAFRYVPPGADESGRMRPGRLSIENIDRSIIEATSDITSPFTLTTRLVRSSNVEQVEIGPIRLRVDEIDYDASEITAQLGKEKRMDLRYPALSFTPDVTPGLF